MGRIGTAVTCMARQPAHAEKAYRFFLASTETTGPLRCLSPRGKVTLKCCTTFWVDLLRPRRRPKPRDQCKSPASKSAYEGKVLPALTKAAKAGTMVSHSQSG